MAARSTQVKILVPGSQPMVALLGQRDELLRLIESAFDSQILVRGNEITITGEEREAEKVAQLFEELLEILGQGQTLTTDSVGKTIDMIKEEVAKPSAVLGAARPSHPRPSGRSATWTPSANPRSRSASDRPARGRPILRWPRR
jgi:phosphate starvation-inducible protein PhoH